MKRIVFMVIRNLFRAPVWFYKIWKMGLPDDEHTDLERYLYLKRVVSAVCKTGRVNIKVCGKENIPEDNGFILFPNHQGLFDMLAIIEACDKPLRAVVKKEAANIILVKQVVNLLRGVSIDREDVRSSLKIIKQMTEDVKEGKNYIIFAEGTRSKQGNQILKFKGGTFKSAVNAGCPIVPVALIDSYKPFDISSIKKEQVQVHFLEPMLYEEYVGMKTIEIADIVYSRIQNKINENITGNQTAADMATADGENTI